MAEFWIPKWVSEATTEFSVRFEISSLNSLTKYQSLKSSLNFGPKVQKCRQGHFHGMTFLSVSSLRNLWEICALYDFIEMTFSLVTKSFHWFVAIFSTSWLNFKSQRSFPKEILEEGLALASRLTKNPGLFFLDTLMVPISYPVIIFQRKNRRLFLVARRVSPFWTFEILEF